MCLNVYRVGFLDRIDTPCVSWTKATDKNMRDYKDILSLKLQSIDVPTDVLVCGDITCSNKTHFQLLNKYVTDITESCISAAESVIPRTCRRQYSGRITG